MAQSVALAEIAVGMTKFAATIQVVQNGFVRIFLARATADVQYCPLQISVIALAIYIDTTLKATNPIHVSHEECKRLRDARVPGP